MKTLAWTTPCLFVLIPLACVQVDALDFESRQGEDHGALEEASDDGGNGNGDSDSDSDSHSIGRGGEGSGGETHVGVGGRGLGRSGGETSVGVGGLGLGGGPDGQPTIHRRSPFIEGAVEIYSGGDVRSLSTYDGDLYWTEYGSFDDFGGYNFDGSLRKTPLDPNSGRVARNGMLVANELHGPYWVRVGVSGAFVIVERSTLLSPDPREETWLVDLDLGSYALFPQADASDRYDFRVAFNSSAGFVAPGGGGNIYRQPVEGEAELLLEHASAHYLAVNDTHLFYSGENGTFRYDLIDGGQPEEISLVIINELLVHNDLLIGVGSGSEAGRTYLAGLPADGSGTWTPLIALSSTENVQQLEVVNDRYYAFGSSGNLVTGSLEDPDGPQTVIAFAEGNPHRVWTSSTAGLYYLDDDQNILHLSLEAIDALPQTEP